MPQVSNNSANTIKAARYPTTNLSAFFFQLAAHNLRPISSSSKAALKEAMEALILWEPDIPSTRVPCSGLRSFKTLENCISAHLLVRSYISISLLFLPFFFLSSWISMATNYQSSWEHICTHQKALNKSSAFETVWRTLVLELLI